jgi:hypothetical protein
MVKKRTRPIEPAKPENKGSLAVRGQLLSDLRKPIHEARTGVAQAVNSALVLLHWQVGQRIRSEILGGRRAAYGDAILSTVSKESISDYGLW